MLPQILKSGLDYYVFHRPGDHEKDLPEMFLVESSDEQGSAFKIPFGYGSGEDRNWGAAGRCYGIGGKAGNRFYVFLWSGKSWRRSYHSKLKRDISAPGTGRGEAYLFSSNSILNP